MAHALEVEIERNYAAFGSLLADLLENNRGEYALLRTQRLEGVYRTAGDAGSAGYRLFGHEPFSIQLITDETEDLGFYSHANPDR